MLGFPAWIIVTHWCNFLFLTLLMRSGLEILANHPKLYWNDHCRSGTEWLRFTKKQFSSETLFASTDEEESFSPIIALPGRINLGLGRYWHFAAVMGWLITGLLYIGMLGLTSQWQRLVPTSWSIFPEAWQVLLTYMQFELPPEASPSHPQLPYNALQQLIYFGLVFILTPLQIATGIVMSPAIAARFPKALRLFGGHQGARSLHFLGLVAYAAFLVTHLVMVFWHGFAHEMGKIVLGEDHASMFATSLGIGIIAAVIAFNIVATVASLRSSERTREILAKLVDPIRTRFFHGLRSHQHYSAKQISLPHRINGYPPIRIYPQAHDGSGVYEELLNNHFKEWRLHISGLVRHPIALSLQDLRALPYTSQVVEHVCIQGWTGIGKWGGVPIQAILDLCDPLPNARVLAFYSYQKHEKAYELYRRNEPYYECIEIELARRPQSIIALDLNDFPLPLEYGAPARLRVETVLGFKMVKYLRSIQVVENIQSVGAGHGGCREDLLYYDNGAEI